MGFVTRAGTSASIGALVTALALAGCSKDPEGASRPAPAPQVTTGSTTQSSDRTELEAAWTSQVAVDPAGTGRAPAAPVLVGEVLVVSTQTSVVGLDPQSGRTVWQADLKPCALEPQPRADRLVLLGGSDCKTLAALDVATGEIAWQRPGIGAGGRGEQGIFSGTTTVALRPGLSCGPLQRFDVATGRPLGKIKPTSGTGCDEWAARDGWLLHLTGAATQAAVLEATDLDTGKRRFSRPLEWGQLFAVLSTDPLVVDLAEAGHRLRWRLDSTTGELRTPLGSQIDLPSGTELVPSGASPADDVLVVERRDPGQGFYARGAGGTAEGWSLTDNQSAWTLPNPQARYLATVDDGLLTVDAPFGEPTELTLTDAADTTRYRSYGAVPAEAEPFGLIGDNLVGAFVHAEASDGQDVTTVAAYRLPDAETTQRTRLTQYQAAEQQAKTAGGVWAEGEVRPTATPCELSTETLAGFGFERLDLPRPENCRFVDRYGRTEMVHSLEVGTTIATPDADASATEKASALVAQFMSGEASGLVPLTGLPIARKPVRVSGLGDEAWYVHGSGLAGQSGNTSLLVRVRNVVVRVQMSLESYEPPTALEAAFRQPSLVVAAARERFDQVGIDLATPELTDDAPTLRAADLCQVGAAQAQQVVPGRPGRQAAPEASRTRLTGCAWAPNDPDDHRAMILSLEAVDSDPLTKTSGAELAKAAVNRVRTAQLSSAPRRLRGLGDSAVLRSGDGLVTIVRGKKTIWNDASVVAQRGHVVVAVTLSSATLTVQQLEQAAEQAARAALATQGR